MFDGFGIYPWSVFDEQPGEGADDKKGEGVGKVFCPFDGEFELFDEEEYGDDDEVSEIG